jgi:hypothetical protein
MTQPARKQGSTGVRRSPRHSSGKDASASVGIGGGEGKGKSKTPAARKSLHGRSSKAKENTVGMAAEGGSNDAVVATSAKNNPVAAVATTAVVAKKKRVVTSAVKKMKRKNPTPVRTPKILMMPLSESEYSDDEPEEKDDDDRRIEDDNSDEEQEAVAEQETTDDEGGGGGGNDDSDNGSEASSARNRKKKRKIQQSEDDNNEAAGGDWDHGDDEVVDSSLTHAGKRDVQSPDMTTIQNVDYDIQIRALSKSESLKNQQPHVAQRIRAFVKTELFRKIKFINNDVMFRKAFNCVMEHEHVPQDKRAQFQMIYESTFNDALNQKRSSCEQTGGDIVRKSIRDFAAINMEMFTMEELCKLRRAGNDRERDAFHWFFALYLESVCGKRSWGRQKKHQLISEAKVKGGNAKLVMKSDEAFALLMFENYIDKWKAMVADEDADEGEDDGDRKMPARGGATKKEPLRLRGIYTKKKSGHCKYSGWSRKGIARFNELYQLVCEDRASENAAAMEQMFLRRMQRYFKMNNSANANDDGEDATTESILPEASVVEAAWDLDE